MIFGITLTRFQKLLSQGEDAKIDPALLQRISKTKLRTRNIEDLTFSDFVDLERFFENNDYKNFCRIFVKRKFFVFLHHMPLVMEDYGNQKKELFKQFLYIFDPPQYGEPQKETIGSELRKEFVEEFGSWVVLMDVACKGRLADYKAVEKWKLGEFLFWANYLTGQKIIENVK